jgi:hypothetical protein
VEDPGPGTARPGTAFIRVHRAHAPWRDRLARYRLQIDGVTVGRLSHDQSVEVPVAPGAHRVRMTTFDRVFTSRQQVFSLEAGEIAVLHCRAGGPALMMIFAIFVPRRYIRLSAADIVRPGTPAWEPAQVERRWPDQRLGQAPGA